MAKDAKVLAKSADGRVHDVTSIVAKLPEGWGLLDVSTKRRDGAYTYAATDSNGEVVVEYEGPVWLAMPASAETLTEACEELPDVTLSTGQVFKGPGAAAARKVKDGHERLRGEARKNRWTRERLEQELLAYRGFVGRGGGFSRPTEDEIDVLAAKIAEKEKVSPLEAYKRALRESGAVRA